MRHYIGDTTHYRIRIDRFDTSGKVSLQRAGKMHHLGARTENAHKRVLMLIDDTTVTVAELTAGEVLSQQLVDPNQNCWPDKLKTARRWPDTSERNRI